MKFQKLKYYSLSLTLVGLISFVLVQASAAPVYSGGPIFVTTLSGSTRVDHFLVVYATPPDTLGDLFANDEDCGSHYTVKPRSDTNPLGRSFEHFHFLYSFGQSARCLHQWPTCPTTVEQGDVRRYWGEPEPINSIAINGIYQGYRFGGTENLAVNCHGFAYAYRDFSGVGIWMNNTAYTDADDYKDTGNWALTSVLRIGNHSKAAYGYEDSGYMPEVTTTEKNQASAIYSRLWVVGGLPSGQKREFTSRAWWW